MHLFELAYACRLYGQTTRYDAALEALRSTVGEVDLRDEASRMATLKWLNAWGCRQFAVAQHHLASEALQDWWESNGEALPGARHRLEDLNSSELAAAGVAYGDLMDRVASVRGADRRPVRFGPAGSAKTLFLLRPQALPPWDEPIRKALGYGTGKESYERYLRDVRQQLSEVAAEGGVDIHQLPALIGRETSSPPKLIDEYNWIVLTHGLIPPSKEEIERWRRWATQAPP